MLPSVDQDLVGRYPGVGYRDDQGLAHLSPLLVWHANDRHVGDPLMRHQGVLHLGWVHVLPTRDDHVLHPVVDVEVTVLHIGEIPAPEPTVARQGLGRLLGHVPVTLHDPAVTHPDLAHLAVSYFLTGFRFDDLHLHAPDGLAGRPQQLRVGVAPVVLGRQRGPSAGGLCHPVHLEVVASELLHGFHQDVLSDGRGSVGDVLHR